MTTITQLDVDPAYRSGGYVEIDGDEADIEAVPDGTALGDDDRLSESFKPSLEWVSTLEELPTQKDDVLSSFIGEWSVSKFEDRVVGAVTGTIKPGSKGSSQEPQ